MLQVTQGYVSRLERQDDMLLSRLYAYVQALGGEVEIGTESKAQAVRVGSCSRDCRRDPTQPRIAFAASTAPYVKMISAPALRRQSRDSSRQLS
jgi:hypothetical protein